MKRLILAAAGAGAMSLALVAGPVSAGASAAKASAPRVRPNAAPIVTVTPHANLKAGEDVEVRGSGFPDKTSYIFTECNADGGGPGALGGSCDTTAIRTGTTSATGTFSNTYKIVVGPMKTGLTDVGCPQDAHQAQHAVQCIIGAVTNLGKPSEQFAFSPLNFAAPALTFTYAKSVIPGTYSVTISESGDYTTHGDINDGGYLVIGAYGSAVPPSRLCQGTTTGATWTPPGLPACTKYFGEVVQINFNGEKVALVRASPIVPGTFSWTIKSAKPGNHAVEAIGLVSGEELTGTAVVP